MPEQQARGLALFDLDHTLIPLDSDHAFGEWMCELGWADPASFREANDQFYADYKAGRLDLAAYVRFSTAPWRARPPEQQAQAVQGFLERVIAPRLHDSARALVEHHRAQGDLLAIVTATNEFVSRPVAALFQPDEILAVNLCRDEAGNMTGDIDGVPTYQAGKITRVESWLAGLGCTLASFDRVSFYSDSPNDLPLLERVGDPVATNPSPELEAVAHERGWRILKLFE